MPLLNRLFRVLCRLLLGLTFIFSGFVKGVDPWGTAYKIQDYFTAFGLESLSGFALVLSVALSVVELLLGLLLLFAQLRRVALLGIGVMLLIFTPVTLYLAIANPVSDCGCFGDAIKLSNWETFGKNVILLLAAVILYLYGWMQKHPYNNNRLKFSHLFFLAFSLFPPFYALRHLPLLDFRPYAVGVNIQEAMQIPPQAPKDVYSTTFVYARDGVEQTFDETNYPWDDSTWTYVSSETHLVEQGYRPPIAEFILKDSAQEDVAPQIISDPGASILVVLPSLDDLSKDELAKLKRIAQEVAPSTGMAIYLLTASPLVEISERFESFPSNITPLTGEERPLKTIVRAYPGIVLLSAGTIIGKWRLSDFPMERFNGGNVIATQIRALAQEVECGHLLLLGLSFLLLVAGFGYTAGIERGWFLNILSRKA